MRQNKKTKPRPVIRRRPRLSATVAADTLTTLALVCDETGLPNVGVTIDYVVTDWKRLKSAALLAAAPEASK
jgi:hypothetical protein